MRRSQKHSLLSRLKAATRDWYAAQFHDPAEVRLLEVCGGATLTIGRLKNNGRTFTIVLSRGKLLRSEKFKRVALDNRSIMFMNDIDQVIIIQGNDYQYNVVEYFEQEEALLKRGLRVRYIPQSWLENNPAKALAAVQNFVYS